MYTLTAHACMGVSGLTCSSSSQQSLPTPDICLSCPCLERLLFSLCLPFNSLTDLFVHSSVFLSLHPHPVSCFSLAVIHSFLLLPLVTLNSHHSSPMEPGVNLKILLVTLGNIGTSISIQSLSTKGKASSLHMVRKPSRGPSQGVTENLSILGSLVLVYDCTPWHPLILLNDIPCLQHQRQSFGPKAKPPLMFKRDVYFVFRNAPPMK